MNNEEALSRFQAILTECSSWCKENQLTEMFGMAISALEKQIPKKAINGYECPRCGWGVVQRFYKDEFCHKCGQAIDWRSNEEF